MPNDLNIPINGFNSDSHEQLRSDKEFSYALNANVQNEEGNSYLIQNEHSNLLCQSFPDEDIVHSVTDTTNNCVYHFLSNPTTGCSRIIKICGENEFEQEDTENSCGCGEYSETLADRLEGSEQTPMCEYEVVMTDCCPGIVSEPCLGFSRDKLYSSTLKIEENHAWLYFTDNTLPMRRVDLANPAQYTFTKDDCTGEITQKCLDCEQMRVMQEYEKPCLSVDKLVDGGELTEGAYLAVIAYVDEAGNEISNYMSETNWVMVHNNNDKILMPNEIARETSKAIKYKIGNLDDKKFKYYALAFITKKNVMSEVEFFKTPPIPINQNEYTLSTLAKGNGILRISLNEIDAQKPIYDTAKFVNQINNRLFWLGLTKQRDYNLQPIVSLLGEFMKVRTMVGDEELYADGANCAKYEQFMGDEVYPLGLKFFGKNGYFSNLFPLVGRAAKDVTINNLTFNELDVINANDINYKSIQTFTPACEGSERNKMWQYYNTAHEDTDYTLDCPIPAGIPTETITKTFKRIAQSTETETLSKTVVLKESDGSLNKGEQWVDLSTYINNHRNIFTPGSTAVDVFGLRAIMSGLNDLTLAQANALFSCKTSVGDATKVSEIIAVLNEGDSSNMPISNTVKTYKTLTDYTVPDYQSECYNKKRDSNGYVRDSAAETIINPDRKLTIYKRDTYGLKFDCNTSQQLAVAASGTTPIAISQHIPYSVIAGATNEMPYLTTINSTADVSKGFYNKLHKNAIWNKITTNTINNTVFFVSKTSECTDNDFFLYSDWLRVSVYDSCGGTLIYSEIFNKNNGYKLLFDANSPINSTANTTYYIAIDSPILHDTRTVQTGALQLWTLNDWYISGTCGCMEVQAQSGELIKEEIAVSNYLLSKNITYTKQCQIEVPADIKCNPYVDKQYNFAYWESTDKYPCNDELWDSSILTVNPTRIPIKYRNHFADVFTTGTSGGNYVMNVANTKFSDKPIRHFKFPDDRVAPHQDNDDVDVQYGTRNKIYIKGVWIDNEIINAMLDVAFDSGLITKKEREDIVGYEIYRGNRRLDRSVIAKGLAYDMLDYKDEGGMKWQTPNYPFNDLSNDKLHSYNNQNPEVNNQGRILTFHSPETSYDLPNLGTEVKFEMFKYGETSGRFAAVEDYPKYTILSQSAFTTAELLASAQFAIDTAIKLSELLGNDSEVYRTAVGFSNSINPVGIGVKIAAYTALSIAYLANAPFKIGQYKSEWIKIFYENGTPVNFASMYVGRCRYEGTYRDNENTPVKTINSNSVRGVSKIFKLSSDRYQISGSGYLDVNINNKDREDSVYINLGELNGQKYPFEYPNVNPYADTSRFKASEEDACNGLISKEVNGRNAFSPYISLKHYLPNQYGTINSLLWVNTCYCGKLTQDNSCDVVFGGDTYISRFSLKRKMRFFYEDSWNAASLTPFNHSEYYNVPNPVHYIDFNNQMSDNFTVAEYPTVKSGYKLDCQSESGNYVNGGKFYLYYYGITHFLVESTINNNFRYGQNDKEKNFYENVADYVAWCQNKNVHITEPNRYYYNALFSTDQQNILGYKILPAYYNRVEWDATNNVTDRAIYSQADYSSKQLYADPYLIYKPLDKYDFGKDLGTPFGIHSIEDMKAVAVFENAFVVFNAYSEIQGSNDSYQLGDGNIFNTRPTTLFKTDLGYAGTQSRAFKKTQFGHFWIDSKRGTIHNIQSGAKDYMEISDNGTYNWFKENLPFNILKDFKNIDSDVLDNPINGLGIAMGWDNRFQRLFVTKRDARVKPEFKTRITYTDKTFFLDGNVKIYPSDSRFFDDYSWTRAYMPKLPKEMNKWISFYSFKPHAYIEHIDYFKTLINEQGSSSIWSHLRTNKSYQVFYNKLYPFKAEIAYKSNFFNKQFSNLEWWLDVLRYHNEIDYAKLEDRNFDWLVFYNKSFNTGKLNLINRDYNNLHQESTHPKFNADSVDIISSFDDNRWFVNDIYDLNNVHNKNVPVWLNTKANDDKDLNPKAFQYVNKWRDRMRMDTASLMLVQDKESRLKYILKMAKNLNKPFD